jgi:hypothetical protein
MTGAPLRSALQDLHDALRPLSGQCMLIGGIAVVQILLELLDRLGIGPGCSLVCSDSRSNLGTYRFADASVMQRFQRIARGLEPDE